MGEKIKDLQSIHIGDAELMIELNEGYTKNEGRLIHIQNKHFRYLLKEKDFLKLAAAILRSKREMEYVKSEDSILKLEQIPTYYDETSDVEKEIERSFGDIFRNEGIRYRIVSDGARFITILVHQNDRNILRSCFAGFQMKEVDHPYTEKAGYVYLYQMNPFELFVYNENIFIEVFYQLPCMSLTPKNWIPLDRAIQTHVWETEIMDKNNCLILDPVSKMIFISSWSVFTGHGFSDKSKAFVKTHKGILKDEELTRLMKTVFFNFSDDLCELLMEEKFDQILKAFYRFDNY